MNLFLLAVFLVLMTVEGAGTATFLALYLRSSDWHTTPVGRHLAYYSGALLFLYGTGIVSVFIHSVWLLLVILVGHVVFAGVIWQRVLLVWRAQRRTE